MRARPADLTCCSIALPPGFQFETFAFDSYWTHAQPMMGAVDLRRTHPVDRMTSARVMMA